MGKLSMPHLKWRQVGHALACPQKSWFNFCFRSVTVYPGGTMNKSAEERDQGVARRRGRLPHRAYPCRPRRAMAVSGVVQELGAGPGGGTGGTSGSGGFFTLRSNR